jgi:DNA-binding Xre family transcriptional regulator
MSKDENVSMDILIKVCKVLECKVGDMMDILPDADEKN